MSNLKNIFYPLICFFSLILSLVVLAQLAQLSPLADTANLIKIGLFFVYDILLVISGYLLTKSQNIAALAAASLILLFSVGFLLFKQANFQLMIYYLLYAVIVAVCSLFPKLSQKHNQINHF